MKHQVKNSEELSRAMEELELKLKVQEVKMKDHYEQVKENLQPKNVLKNTFSHIAETPELQGTLVNTVIGLAIGFAFKKVTEIMSEQSLDNLASNLVSSGLNKLEQRDRNSILSKGITMLRKHTPTDSSLYQYIGYKQQ